MEVQVIKKLRKIVGKDDVYHSQLDLKCYARDRLPWASNKNWMAENIQFPAVVVRPETTDEVAGIVKLANQNNMPIVPRSAGTGFMGAAVAVKKNSILIDMRKMDKILEINEIDRKVVVQPGINLERLEEKLEAYNLIIGHDPGSTCSSTIGGAICNDGTGALCNKFGTMRDMVLGLTVVMPTGEVLKTNDASKSAIGYNLKYLFIGAEGTLGVITEVSLKAKPRGVMRLACWEFKTFLDAYKAIDKIGKVDLIPARISLQDQGRSGSLSRATGRTVNASVAACFLENELLMDHRFEMVVKSMEASGGILLPEDVRQYWWDTRHDYPQSEGVWQVLETCVPWSKIPEAYTRVNAVLDKTGYNKSRSMGCFAYNPTPWSVDLYFDENDEKDMQKVIEIEHEIRRLSYHLGGSMSSCHGIGMFLPDLAKEELGYSLEIMKKIKTALDPENIMNPGKMGL
jgi:glycolate oxidase